VNPIAQHALRLQSSEPWRELSGEACRHGVGGVRFKAVVDMLDELMNPGPPKGPRCPQTVERVIQRVITRQRRAGRAAWS
jgi:hypothetical protein